MTLARPITSPATLGCHFLARLPAAMPGLLLAALVSTAILIFYNPQVLHGELIDPDSYMRLVRLRAVIADGAWHGGFFARDNAPFGMALHWSKAYDLILLALAAPLAAFVGWQPALVWVAPMVGPLATGALIAAAVWAAAPICQLAERRLIGVVLALAPMVIGHGAIGDADHHVVVAATWVLFMGFALRAGMGGGARQGVWAGIAAAFALWISVECILGVGSGIALMGLVWVRQGKPLRSGSLAFAATFAVAMSLVLAFDPPYGGWLQAEASRISILYVTFAALLALLWTALAVAPQDPQAWRTRLAVAIAGAALSALCLALLFPKVLAPEHAVFDADSEFRFWGEVDEMQPAFQHPAKGILFVGSPAIGLAVAVILAWRERHEAAGRTWAALAFMLALLTALAMRHLRFALYPEALAALPIAALLTRIELIMEEPSWAAMRQFGRVLASMTVFVGPLVLASMLPAATPEQQTDAAQCAVRPVASALNDSRFMGGTNLVIMSHPNEAPDLLYWTGHRVVAGPYHTNVEGIRDLLDFFASRDDVAPRDIAVRRGIAFVMLCGGHRAITDKADPEGRALITRLLRGDAPAWLAAQPWPAPITSDLRLFRVMLPEPSK